MIEIDLIPFAPPPILQVGDQAMLDQVLSLVAEGARAEWIRLAMETITDNVLDYVNGIQPVEYSPGIAIITLLGELANQLENGMPARDMRDFLLGSKIPVIDRPKQLGQKGKYQAKKGGYYRPIPFRHKVGKQGAGLGNPFAAKGAPPDAAAALGRDIYQQARGLIGSTSEPGSAQTQWGGRLPANTGPKLSPSHKSPLFGGMVRLEKTYERATQSQYVTFRTISTNVSDGWMLPAQPGLHLAQGVTQYVAQIAPMSFDEYVKAALGEGEG